MEWRSRRNNPELTLIRQPLPLMILLNHIIYMTHRTAHKQRKHKRNNIMSSRPHIHINRIQHSQQRQSPADPVDDDLLAGIGELVEEGAEEEEVDEGPDGECPGCGGEVGCFCGAVYVL